MKSTAMSIAALDNCTRSQLETMREALEARIQAAKVKEAQDQIQEIARKHGFGVSFTPVKNGNGIHKNGNGNGHTKKARKAKGSKVLPKYRNPDDHSQTWSGRGRPARWITAGLKAGKKMEDFRIGAH